MPLEFPIFFTEKSLKGWRACVEGRRRIYCRVERTEEAAEDALRCLRRTLVARPGPTMPVVEEWASGKVCGRPLALGGLKRRRPGRRRCG